MPTVRRGTSLAWTKSLVAVALLLSGCDSYDGSCPTTPALVLTIVDKATRENIANLAQISVRRLTPFPDSASGRFSGPTDVIGRVINPPPGLFEVRVDVPGYTPWVRQFDFAEGECGELATRTVAAEMTR